MNIPRSLCLFLFTMLICDAVNAQWSPVASYGEGPAFSLGSFVVDNTAYTLGGNFSLKTVYKYEASSDEWTLVGDIPGGANRASPIAFSIKGIGYVGCGAEKLVTSTSSFYAYDPAKNEWNQKSDFGGTYRFSAFSATANDKGYVIGGSTSFGEDVDEVWEYKPFTDQWIQKDSRFPAGKLYWPAGFVINNEIYVGTGAVNSVGYNDFYRYTPATDTWTKLEDFPGAARMGAIGFTFNGIGYIGGGLTTDFATHLTDFYSYNPKTDTWVKEDEMTYPTKASVYTTSFVLNNEAYVGAGALNVEPTKEFYSYDLGELDPNGINVEMERITLRVFPNPNNGQFSITSNAATGPLSIYNVQGQKVHETNLLGEGINHVLLPESIASGVYYVSGMEQYETTITKLIITRQ